MKQNTTQQYQEWLQQAIREQQQIGWEKIWQGYFTQSWGDIQENHYRTKNLPKTNTGANWIKNVIQHIWAYILELWKTRNAKIHNDLKTKSPQKKILVEKMTRLYKKHQTHNGEYKFLFTKTIQDLTLQNKSHLERWIDLAEMIDHSTNIQNILRKPKGKDIKKYLSASSKPPSK